MAVGPNDCPPYKIQHAWSIQIVSSDLSCPCIGIGIAPRSHIDTMDLNESIIIRCEDGMVYGASEKGKLGNGGFKFTFYFDALHRRLTVKKVLYM